MALVTVKMPLPSNFGRIVRRGTSVERIVEVRDATPAELEIDEMNAGIYAFDEGSLREAVTRLRPDNAQAEYYLTDAVADFVNSGKRVAPVVATDHLDVLGINDRVELALARREMNARICAQHMRDGVTIIDPPATYLEPELEIGNDTVIYPNTTISRLSRIGRACTIGPNARLSNARLGDRVTLRESVVIDSETGNDVTIGPFAHLRGETVLADRVHVGNFVEIKKSKLARGVKVSHLSYLGDATVGEETNVGAGHDYLQLRRNEKESDDDRAARFDRIEHVAGCAGHGRRRRTHRRGLGRYEGRSRRRASRGKSGTPASEKVARPYRVPTDSPGLPRSPAPMASRALRWLCLAIPLVAFVLLLGGVASAGMVRPNALDHRVDLLTPQTLMSEPATALVDPARQAAAMRRAHWTLVGWLLIPITQALALFYLWTTGGAASLRDRLRRRIRAEWLVRFLFGASLALVARLASFIPSFYLYRVDRALDVTFELTRFWFAFWIYHTLLGDDRRRSHCCDRSLAGFADASMVRLYDRRHSGGERRLVVRSAVTCNRRLRCIRFPARSDRGCTRWSNAPSFRASRSSSPAPAIRRWVKRKSSASARRGAFS